MWLRLPAKASLLILTMLLRANSGSNFIAPVHKPSLVKRKGEHLVRLAKIKKPENIEFAGF